MQAQKGGFCAALAAHPGRRCGGNSWQKMALFATIAVDADP